MTEPNHLITSPRELLEQLMEKKDYPGYRDVARKLLRFLDHPHDSAGKHTRTVAEADNTIPQSIMDQIGALQVKTQEHVYALQRMRVIEGTVAKTEINKLIEDAIKMSDMLSEAVAEIPTYNGITATLAHTNGNGATHAAGK